MLAALLLSALAASAPFDHSAFDSLLRAHVKGGLVDYDAFARSGAFRSYLDDLHASRPEGWQTSERLAFWINTYNAYTIEQINRHGERSSIRNIRKTLGLVALKGPWSERMVRAAGRELTLDEVENEIIRRQFKEPRIHVALVCAALSCPPLRSEAYRADQIDEQLDDQARTFLLRTPEANRIDTATGTVWVSPVFVWYRADFGGTDAALGQFLARYWPVGPEQALLLSGRFRLRETDYDWTLNSLEKGRARRPR